VLIPSGGGELFNYRWLVRALGDRSPLDGVREPGHYGTERRPRTLAELSTACREALHDAGIERPVAVIGACSGGVVAHALACDLSRDGPGPSLVALLDAPIPAPRTPLTKVRRPVRTGLHRGREAIMLAGLRMQWTWFRLRRVPTPPVLADRLTYSANVRRLYRAQPSYFAGRELYVHAVSADGTVDTPGAPEYWIDRAASCDVVEVIGGHAGDDSFLSRTRVQQTADVLARELAKVYGAGDP
jgi:thioesterase domain-containing protein